MECYEGIFYKMNSENLETYEKKEGHKRMKLEGGSVCAYIAYLKQEEKSKSTTDQYERNVRRFLQYLKTTQLESKRRNGERTLESEEVTLEEESEVNITKDLLIQHKEQLKKQYKFTTINVILASINGFLHFIGKPDLTISLLKIQRQVYCREEKELSLNEYQRLFDTEKEQNDEQFAMLLQTIGGAGIRVSELQYITVEAVEEGQASISLKGKERIILIGGKLRQCLKKYIEKNEIEAGPVFITRQHRSHFQSLKNR